MAAPEGYKTLGKIGISYKGDYNSNTAYERLDAVLHNGSTYLAIKDAPDGAPRDDKINWIYLAKGFSSDIGDSEITFTEAEARENINTGESVKTVFGKIKKFFADLTAPAFAQMITTKDDLLATKATGYVPDAKAVADAVTDVTGKLNQDADLTLVNCVSWSSDNSISKIGNRVFVTIGVQITSEQSSGSLIITNIAKTYYPKNAYVRANATGGTSGNNHNIYINKSSGTIILNPSTERYYSASFSYLSD
jgi:hypothetical protein|nr:MAG TPA: hypothetical protein [Caudoviricetes sp.]